MKQCIERAALDVELMSSLRLKLPLETLLAVCSASHSQYSHQTRCERLSNIIHERGFSFPGKRLFPVITCRPPSARMLCFVQTSTANISISIG